MAWPPPLTAGDMVAITSARASIKGIVEAAKDASPDVISMTHCWGGIPGSDDDPVGQGACTSRLLPLIAITIPTPAYHA